MNTLSIPQLIVHNGRFATQDERRLMAEAVAIKDGRFLAVGSDRDVLALRSHDTEVIDLGGRTVIPGLNDSHLHAIRGGLNYNLELRWDGVPSLADGLRMLRERLLRVLSNALRPVNAFPLKRLFRRTLDTSETTGATQWGLLMLRVVTGALIFYIHGWHKLTGGLDYLRHGAPWPLANEVAEMHFPAPVAAAFAATAVQFLCAPLLVVGLFTRLNALVLTGVLSVAIAQNLLAGRDPQLAILYTLNVTVFVFAGGGPFSLDAKFRATATRLA
jgi:uncharacterized membrane protein YphA (DoxX/SURF4 family)